MGLGLFVNLAFAYATIATCATCAALCNAVAVKRLLNNLPALVYCFGLSFLITGGFLQSIFFRMSIKKAPWFMYRGALLMLRH